MNKEILRKVDNYYTEKLKEFGSSPKGVDWNSEESQELRYRVLSQIIDPSTEFSILDFGCGYGGMLDYFIKTGYQCQYTGFDISKEMVNAASLRHPPSASVCWLNNPPISAYDYVVASGIFNVRLDNNDAEWEDYLLKTLGAINGVSKVGFAFNVLTRYSDKEYMKNHLYYADPLKLFDYCKKNFSKNVALLHDYDLYEFTMLIRKQ
jgi:SAM-dependent methyltransferase